MAYPDIASIRIRPLLFFRGFPEEKKKFQNLPDYLLPHYQYINPKVFRWLHIYKDHISFDNAKVTKKAIYYQIQRVLFQKGKIRIWGKMLNTIIVSIIS